MLKSSSKDKGLYRDKLQPDAKKRYLQKLECIGNVDPYEIRQWRREPEELPPLTFPDIFSYLVCGVSAYTAKQFCNYKSMEAHMQFTNGWVHDLDIFKPPLCDYIVIQTKVMHSQRLNQPALKPWVIVSNTGKVESAHCTCMAGVAESCTHVAALLFKVEATVRIRGSKTVTDVPAYWVLPGNLTKIQPEVGYKIDYTSSAAQKKGLDKQIDAQSSKPVKRSRPQKRTIPPANLEDLSPLLDTLQEHSKAVGLSGMEKYHTLYTVHSPSLPQSLASLYNNSVQSLDLTGVLQCCQKHLSAAAVNYEQAEAIERHTIQQHNSPDWYKWRAGRITASVMHAVFATSLKTPALSVVRRVCYPCNSVSVEQTKWGQEHEDNARKAYTEDITKKHNNLMVRQCGFIVNPCFPEIGASPDGLTMCDCCGKGCLEIKCPFKYRRNSIQQALDAKDKDFCLESTANELILKKSHPYYSQVQTQIYVTNSNHCDLVVWTLRDMAVVRIFPDQDFWESRLQKAQEFFKNVCLPELLVKYFSSCHYTPCLNEP